MLNRYKVNQKLETVQIFFTRRKKKKPNPQPRKVFKYQKHHCCVILFKSIIAQQTKDTASISGTEVVFSDQ